jgi:hypothetical protein
MHRISEILDGTVNSKAQPKESLHEMLRVGLPVSHTFIASYQGPTPPR